MDNTSGKFRINWTDHYKTIRGFMVTLFAVVGTAAITHVASVYTDWNYNVCVQVVPCMDLRFLLVPVIGAGIEYARRFFSNYKNK